MKLILARHSETVENASGISQGHLPGTLSEKGLQQAKELALKLKGEKIDGIYSSDLRRAADTAKAVAEFHPNAEFVLSKGLREVDLKGLTGTKIDWSKSRPKGIESRSSMRDRARKVLEQVFSKHPNGCVLFVSHNGINKAVIRIIRSLPPDHSLHNVGNASFQSFEVGKDAGGKFFLKEN